VPTREAPGTPGQRIPNVARTAQAVPSSSAVIDAQSQLTDGDILSCDMRKCSWSSVPLTSMQWNAGLTGIVGYNNTVPMKEKMGPLARSDSYVESLTGGAWRFARRHPRLLLFVRFADKPR
jgi:hypothetical protein